MRTSLVSLAGALACACGGGPEPAKLPTDVPASFSRSGGVVAPDKFWTAFGDSDLDGLVAEALRSNLDLEAGFHRLEEAKAIARREGAPLYPSLEATAVAQYREPEAFQNDTIRLGLSATYEVDLWGQLRSGRDAARFRAEASRYDYRALGVSIAAEVCIAWYRLVEARAQLALLDEQIATNEKVAAVLRSQFGAGEVRSVDVLRQRQLVESTRALKLAVEADVEIFANQLAVLLGRAPRASSLPARAELPTLPPMPTTGLPSELIERRPDVQRARHELFAADRDVASAVSNRYPRLSLTASAGTRGGGGGVELFRDWFATLAANLFAPIIDGGERRAEVARSEAVKMQRLYAYGQAALIALREVEDALVAEDKQLGRIASLESQLEMSRKSTAQLQIEYLNGIAEYIDVLTALTSEQQLRRDLLASRRIVLELRVALYRALAGGFDR